MAPRKAKKRANKQYDSVLKQEEAGEMDFLSETEAEMEMDANSELMLDEIEEYENIGKLQPKPKLVTKIKEKVQDESKEELNPKPVSCPTTTVNNAESEPTSGPSSWLKHNFIHKLHFFASCGEIKYINWSDDNEFLQLNYMGLQDHLLSKQNMFYSRSIGQFVRQLLEVGFERVQWATELDLYFEHKYFKPAQQKWLARIATPYLESGSGAEEQQQKLAKDPCNMLHGFIPKLQLARTRFKTLLSYHNGVRLLQNREPSVEEQPLRRGRYVASSKQLMAKPKLTPALEAIFVSPQDAADVIEVDHVADYAGYYGNVNPALINEFFGEYLPRYTPRNGSNQTDIVVDVSKLNAFQQNLPIGIVLSEDEDELNEEETMATATTATTANEMPVKDDDGQSQTEIVGAAAPPNDMELERMMDDLWGNDTVEGAHMPTTMEILGPETNIETKPIEQEHHFRSAAEIAAVLQDEPEIIENVKKPIEKVAKKKKKIVETPAEETDVSPKKRRYDLRNSKKRQL